MVQQDESIGTGLGRHSVQSLPKQLLPGSSLSFRGLGSVKTGHIDSHRPGSQSDCLFEAKAQEERAGSHMGSEWFWVSEISIRE